MDNETKCNHNYLMRLEETPLHGPGEYYCKGTPAPDISELRGIVARGYCHDKNSHKVLDGDLLEAIVEELLLVLPSQPGCGMQFKVAPQEPIGVALGRK